METLGKLFASLLALVGSDRVLPEFCLPTPFPHPQDLRALRRTGVFCLTADKIAQIFGVRKHKRLRGKLHSMLERLDHGHHVLRVYCKSPGA